MPQFMIQAQPTDETCGPTSLHSIYRYYGHKITLPEVIKTVERSQSGGTLAPLLGLHALKNHFEATIYVNNLNLFDPTWFKLENPPPARFLIQKLKDEKPYQLEQSSMLQANESFERFLEYGGKVKFKVLTGDLIKNYLINDIPILTGLSATYLYGSTRERYTEKGESVYDDIRGKPCGHFVVLTKYSEKDDTVTIADPLRKNPISHDNYYHVPMHRLINAILLGVFTYDANLLIIHPKGTKRY